MSVEEFLDTNIFVYLFDETDDRKRTRAEGLVRSALEEGTACISYQVIQETLNVMTGKLEASSRDAKGLLDDVLMPLWHIYPTHDLYRRGLDIHDRYGFSFYDSLMVASALDAGCRIFYSEDLQHNQTIEGLTVVNPFLNSG